MQGEEISITGQRACLCQSAFDKIQRAADCAIRSDCYFTLQVACLLAAEQFSGLISFGCYCEAF